MYYASHPSLHPHPHYHPQLAITHMHALGEQGDLHVPPWHHTAHGGERVGDEDGPQLVEVAREEVARQDEKGLFRVPRRMRACTCLGCAWWFDAAHTIGPGQTPIPISRPNPNQRSLGGSLAHRHRAHAGEPRRVADLQGRVKEEVEARGQEGGVELDLDPVDDERRGGVEFGVGKLRGGPEEDEGRQEDGPDAEDVDELYVCVRWRVGWVMWRCRCRSNGRPT